MATPQAKRTKQEVRDFLNTLIGLSVNAKTGKLQGQCVSLIKALMEFLGVSDPYAARGDAKDAGNRYLKDGIAKDGSGWLTIIINPNMGGGYGHIWADLKDEANFEQNGAIALHTTKNTRPWNQGEQFINFDQWIQEDIKVIPDTDAYYKRYGVRLAAQTRGRYLSREEFRKYIVGLTDLQAVELLSDAKEADVAQNWQDVGKRAVTDKWEKQINNLTAENESLKKQLDQKVTELKPGKYLVR